MPAALLARNARNLLPALSFVVILLAVFWLQPRAMSYVGLNLLLNLVLPIAFGFLNDVTGLWTSCFMLMFVVVMASLIWMHIAVRRMERASGNATQPADPAYAYVTR